jgi:hypothetical protein
MAGIFSRQEQVSMTRSVLDKTRFRNVDLDISSKSDLQPLVTAMGSKISLSFVGRVKRTYYAHMDLAIGNPKSPESAILQYCKLIRGLSPDAKAAWYAAKTRIFDIGIEAPGRNSYYWTAVSEEAIKASAEVNAQVAVTVYGPMKRMKRKAKANKSKSAARGKSAEGE